MFGRVEICFTLYFEIADTNPVFLKATTVADPHFENADPKPFFVKNVGKIRIRPNLTFL